MSYTLEVVRGDLTTLTVDAVVNAANSSLSGGGGVDGAIHRAAGPELLAECKSLNGCPTGEANLTGAYHLPAHYVIHTVGPVWQGGMSGEPALLAACYRNSLLLATEHSLTSLAFPAISCGVYGYPIDKACALAVATITEFFTEYLDTTSIEAVYLCAFGNDVFHALQRALLKSS